MKIILAPAKQMVEEIDSFAPEGIPVFLEETMKILAYLQSLSFDQLKTLWACNEKIAQQNYERILTMDLSRRLTPAILAYDGIAYKHMAPGVFTDAEFQYVKDHLRILSGFYGVLKPMDGVTPYRLEMQAKTNLNEGQNLYHFWGDRLYHEVLDDSRTILNLASKEYSKCIEKYLGKEDRMITCAFCEEEKGKLVQKGVYAKMARGEMVRFLAENGIERMDDVKKFNRLGYRFCEMVSDDKNYTFLK